MSAASAERLQADEGRTRPVSMIRFIVGGDGPAGRPIELEGAYACGADGVPVRATLDLHNGELRCRKNAAGPVAISLLWKTPPFGAVMLETVRVMERDRPYILPVELARGRLMRISQKREDWGLFDYPGGDELYARVDAAKAKFVSAMTAASDVKAVELGNEALSEAVAVGEDLAVFHAGVFLDRRKQSQQFANRPLGCVLSTTTASEAYRARLTEAFDFVVLPVNWRNIEPKQGTVAWDSVDPWTIWAHKQRMPLRAAPLVSFHKMHVPDWLVLYEQDFDAVRDLTASHVRRTVQRFGAHVQSWDVVSGIHANNAFNFTLEQLMELTRMCSLLVRQIAPRSTTVIDLVAPWGEYYARNPRTIPPLLFADMALQSGVPFDAFGLQFYFGVPADGMYLRDMMQISSMIDRFANFGKPLHITAVQVPSAATPDPADAWRGQVSPAAAGTWRGPWSEAVQAEWLRRFYEIAMSKPFVETVAWRDLADVTGHYLPHGGLLRADLSPKPAYDQLMVFRKNLPSGTDKARPRGG